MTTKPSASAVQTKANEDFANTADSETDLEHGCDLVHTSIPPAEVSERHLYMEHASSTPRIRVDEGTTRRVLTTAPLLAFCFFAICGGPAGSEDMIIAAGPIVGLMSILVFAVGFYIPLACMVTELSTALPISGGHAYWVALAFGPSWGFQAGYWSWVSNCIDCSMYAAMTVSSLIGPADWIKGTIWEFLFKSTFALVLALPGLFSLRVVGGLLLFLMILVLLPYGFVSLWAASEATHWEELLQVRRVNTTFTADGDFVTTGAIAVDWERLVNILVWSFSGFSNISVLAAHVVNPERTFWRVMWSSSVLVPLAYLIPFVTLTAVNKPDWRLWEDGSLGDVAKTLGGEGMAGWIMVVDFVCSAGLYISALTVSAFLANGMAKQGIAPTTIVLTTSGGTPHGAIFCSLAVILVVVNLEFDELLQLTNALGGLEAIMLILASLRLRFTLPNLVRPVRFCGNSHPIVPLLLLLVPITLYGFVIIDAFQSFSSAVLTGAFLFVGLVYARQADYDKFAKQVRETFG